MEVLVLDSNSWNLLTLGKQMIDYKLDMNTWWLELLMLNDNTWDHLTVYKQMSSRFKVKLPPIYSLTNHIYEL